MYAFCFIVNPCFHHSSCAWLAMCICTCLYTNTVSRDHWYERQPALQIDTFQPEWSISGLHVEHCNWSCHQRPPVLGDQFILTMGWSVYNGVYVANCGGRILNACSICQVLYVFFWTRLLVYFGWYMWSGLLVCLWWPLQSVWAFHTCV